LQLQQQQQVVPTMQMMQSQLPSQQAYGQQQQHPPQVADILDDDATVTDVLKQINGSFGVQQPPPQLSTIPQLSQSQTQLQPQSQAQAQLQPQSFMFDTAASPPASVVVGQDVFSSSSNTNSNNFSGSSFSLGNISWLELLRVAIIVALVYIIMHFLPIDPFVSRYLNLNVTTDSTHVVLVIKSVVLAVLFVIAMKLPTM
jgi:hypothetical protein